MYSRTADQAIDGVEHVAEQLIIDIYAHIWCNALQQLGSVGLGEPITPVCLHSSALVSPHSPLLILITNPPTHSSPPHLQRITLLS
jgi:hypothetical protein